MKTMLTRTAITLGLALCVCGASPARGETTTPAPEFKTLSGIMTALDPQAKTLSVHRFWGARTFNVADNCRVVLADKPEASLADLRPGQKVLVRYQNAHGVLVAHQVSQQDMVFTGHISAVDPSRQTLAVRHGLSTRQFTLPADCSVLIKDDAVSVNDLKPGQSVSVTYEKPGDRLVAREVARQSETFEGTIRAIDAETRTIKARNFMREKKFNLADGCKIVVDGNLSGGLNSLRIGDEAVFEYEIVNGVLVVNRIAREAESAETKTDRAANTGPPANPAAYQYSWP